jgi:hypothetical protein
VDVRAGGSGFTGGKLQDASRGADHCPSVQTKLAAPVLGKLKSVICNCEPDAAPGAAAWQSSGPTVQPRVCAAQAAGGGGLQEVLLAAAQTPALQAKLAVPVAGCT